MHSKTHQPDGSIRKRHVMSTALYDPICSTSFAMQSVWQSLLLLLSMDGGLLGVPDHRCTDLDRPISGSFSQQTSYIHRWTRLKTWPHAYEHAQYFPREVRTRARLPTCCELELFARSGEDFKRGCSALHYTVKTLAIVLSSWYCLLCTWRESLPLWCPVYEWIRTRPRVSLVCLCRKSTRIPARQKCKVEKKVRLTDRVSSWLCVANASLMQGTLCAGSHI